MEKMPSPLDKQNVDDVKPFYPRSKKRYKQRTVFNHISNPSDKRIFVVIIIIKKVVFLLLIKKLWIISKTMILLVDLYAGWQTNYWEKFNFLFRKQSQEFLRTSYCILLNFQRDWISRFQSGRQDFWGGSSFAFISCWLKKGTQLISFLQKWLSFSCKTLHLQRKESRVRTTSDCLQSHIMVGLSWFLDSKFTIRNLFVFLVFAFSSCGYTKSGITSTKC